MLLGRRCAGWASRNRSGKRMNGRVQAWGLQTIVPAKGSKNKATEAAGPKRRKRKTSMCRQGEFLSRRVSFRISVTCMMKASSRRSLVRGIRWKEAGGHPRWRQENLRREREFGGHGRVRNKIRISGGDQRSGSKVQVDVGVEADERSKKLVRNTDVVR